MALNKQIWVSQIKENFYPDDSFLQNVVNYSEFVDNDRLHIPSSGLDPDVLINNTTYPIRTVERTDTDNEIILDKFETENTIVRRPEALEYSYNKLESVIGQHRATLRKSVATKAIHAFAPDADTAQTPVIITTGETVDGRKRLTLADVLTLKERFDDAEIPLGDRYLVLHPKHVSDLLLEDVKLFKNITDLQNGQPFRFAGFGFYSFAQMPTFTTVKGVLSKVAFADESTENFASVAFNANEVMKADGEIYMYSAVDDPTERGTIVGFDKRFIALPIRGKGIGAIVSATA
ncbi:MAG: hypothetical protein IKR34_00585 [Candidatus Gastranaerophilales bacterium]|nr:hypothetical protein [Candidatus Gastranaerophilales bacterium]